MADDPFEKGGKTNPSWFQKGKEPGPGRPKGTRNKLGEAFLQTLYDDFQANGAEAVRAARAESPLGYVRVVASLMPQKVEVSHIAAEMTDEELLAIIRGSGSRDPAPPANPPRLNGVVN